jgi:hypothetical protein
LGLLIVAFGENREHRRDAYDTLGSETFEAAIDKRQKAFPSIMLRNVGRFDFWAFDCALGENREHRRDAYDTLGSVTFEAAIDKRQKEFLRSASGCGKI